jgi:hypothetical protein
VTTPLLPKQLFVVAVIGEVSVIPYLPSFLYILNYGLKFHEADAYTFTVLALLKKLAGSYVNE